VSTIGSGSSEGPGDALAVLKPPSGRHPSLGLAPVDMAAAFPAAARKISEGAPWIAARALESAVEADETLRKRFDETGLRRLLRDAEILIERLAMCVGSGEDRFLVDHAESMKPVYRRRGTSLRDLAAICTAIGHVLETELGQEERSLAERCLGEAIVILRADSRLAGDSHSRNALWDWMYRGV
jgi:hypothetical protein